MSSKRLRIINQQKCLKRNKQWHNGKIYDLSGWTIERCKRIQCFHSVWVEDQLVEVLTQEISKSVI